MCCRTFLKRSSVKIHIRSVAPSEKRFRADTRSLLVFQNVRRFQSAPIESERGFKVPPIEIHFETGIPVVNPVTPVYVISYLHPC